MDLGVHLPLLTWDEAGSERVSLIEYVRLSSYADARVQRVFLWPVGEAIEQLELFGERVAPLL